MSGYRRSPLADQAPGAPEQIAPWDGHTMGGRVPAFLGLAPEGGIYWENPPSLDEAVRAAGLDFQVTLEPLSTTVVTDEGVSTLPLPKHFATVQRHPDGRVVPMRPVGDRYTPIQNPTVAEIAGLVLDESPDAALRAVGSFGDPVGSKVYFAFALGQFQVGGHDPHDLYLTVISGHDGTSGLSAQVAPMRVACTNMVGGVFGRTKGRYVIRHTESAAGRVQDIREALQLTHRYTEQYVEESEQMLRQPMTEHDFLAWEHELFGAPRLEDASARQRTITANRDEVLLGVWRGDTLEFGRGTRWAAAQAVYEYLDWLAAARGDDPQRTRWEKAMSGLTEPVKTEAWASLIAG